MLTRFPSRSLYGLTLLLMQIIDVHLYRPSFWDVKNYQEQPQRLTDEGRYVLKALDEQGMLPDADDFERQIRKASETKTGGSRFHNVFYEPLSARIQTGLSEGIPKVREIWSVTDYFSHGDFFFIRLNAFDPVPDYRPLLVLITAQKQRWLKDPQTGKIHHLVPVQLILPFCPCYGGVPFVPFTFPTPLFQAHHYAIIKGEVYVHRNLLQRRVLRMCSSTFKKIKGQGKRFISLPEDHSLWDATEYYDEQKFHLTNSECVFVAEEFEEIAFI